MQHRKIMLLIAGLLPFWFLFVLTCAAYFMAGAAYGGGLSDIRPKPRPPCAWVDMGGYWNIPPACHGRREDGRSNLPEGNDPVSKFPDAPANTRNNDPVSKIPDAPVHTRNNDRFPKIAGDDNTPPKKIAEPEYETEWKDGDRWFSDEQSRGWKNRDGHPTRERCVRGCSENE